MPTDKNDRPTARIAFLVTRGDSIGGAQIHVRDLSRALKADGKEVRVYVGSTGALCGELEASGIPWELVPGLKRNINPFSDLGAIFHLAGRLKEYRPQLLSTHTAKSGLVGRWAALLAGVPSLFTAHGWQFAEGISPLQKALVLGVEKLSAPLSLRTITVSQYDYDLALKYKVVPKDRLRLVHNGMPDLPCPERSDQEEGPCRLLMVARFQDQKDHALLIRTLSGLRDLEWTLNLVGDGPMTEEIKTLVRESGLEGRVEFSGQRLDVPIIMEQSDAYILTSHWEGFPRSILEAMRAGLPVAASDVGGVREAVIPGQTGYLIPEGDGAILKEALEALITRKDLRRLLGTAGRKRFEENFTFRSMYNKTLDVYREIGERDS